MELTNVLLFMMMFAILLSLVSIVMVVVFLLKTNAKIKNTIKAFKLYSMNNWIEKVMKKNDNNFENLESFLNDDIEKRSRFDTDLLRITKIKP